MQASELLRRLRNLAQKVQLRRRKEDDLVEIETRFLGRPYELRELKPYGLASKPESGEGICLFIGGEVRNPVLLPIDNVNAEGKREGQPELADGEVGLYSKEGNRMVLRSDGSVELNGTNYGGLVKWQELQTQLNKVSAFLQTLQQTLGKSVNEAGNGMPSILQKALNLALGTLQLPDYSQHGQLIHYKDDGTLHIEAPGKLSLHSKEEDLYSLIKDLLSAIKELKTAPIDTQVNGGSVALASSGTAPIAGASGTNPGVGLAQSSSQKLDEITQRLDKLLQKGEKPQSAKEQEEKQEKALQKLADKHGNGKLVSDRKFGRGIVTNKTSHDIIGVDWDNRAVETIKPNTSSSNQTDTDFIVDGNYYLKVGAGRISYLGNGKYNKGDRYYTWPQSKGSQPI